MGDAASALSIVVVGASGDLARRKLFPALFALYCQGFLPRDFHVFGFARTPMTDDAFREVLAERLTCRYAPGESCAQRMREFLSRCHYCAGRYDSADSFLDLFQVMHAVEKVPRNRMFCLAIPPSVFLDVARSVAGAGLVQCGSREPWSRVVIEKPFGRDRATSDALTREMGQVFSEEQTYRIDHYLGKEVIQNLLALRFANTIFEPIWNRQHVRSVCISWQEDIGVEGRGGYFDQYGIIRDVMQNHLLQILALTAMETPAGLDSHRIRDAKVQVLRAVAPVEAADLVVGQYGGCERPGGRQPGYREDPTVAPDSITPTYAAAVLRLGTPRWTGVPFLMRAGKGLGSRMTEIRIRFREVALPLFCVPTGCPPANELVIRVQPDEAIYFTIVSKVPGAGMRLHPVNLDLRYKLAFSEQIPDAYENLLLDVVRGDRSLFIRSDELAAAWDIFTPVLAELERGGRPPASYAFGSRGPAEADRLAAKHGVTWPEV